MSGLSRLLDPQTVAVAGVSSDPAKHGARVLGHLRRFGFEGEVWGVNPRMPDIEGLEVFDSVASLPRPPDLVIAAVPARAALDVVTDSEDAGAVIVFASGFAEAGSQGSDLQAELVDRAARSGVRLIGPNSGGVIRPGLGLTASFLTCLDRPAGEVRSGPVGIVTQSGGTGSFIHNLAAARGDGVAVSISTGNEADVRLGAVVSALAGLDEVQVIVAILETVRDGTDFIEAVRHCRSRGKRVVACRVGKGDRGSEIMTSHTAAVARSGEVIDGVLDALGVVSADTPEEAFEVASLLARIPAESVRGTGIVTHSGGAAILLADLAERWGVALPRLSEEVSRDMADLLDHGAATNPIDMGGIIGGPTRFAEMVGVLAGWSGIDAVLAVSTAHPPAHTRERVRSLLALETDRPVVHLWMAGDQGSKGLDALREAGLPVTEDPRAAIVALGGLGGEADLGDEVEPLNGPPQEWGMPIDQGALVSSPEEAVVAAEELGYPVVVKVEAPGLAHKTDVGGVALDLRRADEVRDAYETVVSAALSRGWESSRARVQPHRPGLELIVGALVDESFGPLISVGIGGVLTEILGDVVIGPAPVTPERAAGMIDRLRGRPMLEGYRGSPAADVEELARIVSVVSRGIAGTSGIVEAEINPLIWDGERWFGADWLVRETASASGH